MKNQNPAFSVIIPLYNKEISVQSTIESVLNQTWPHFELIIVNDGSTDNSLEVAQSFEDQRIKFINQVNQGVSGARNRGIKEANNDFVVFLDADDLWFTNCLEEFCQLISKFPEADVFATNYNMSGMNLRGSQKRYLVKDYYYSSALLMAKWNVPLIVTGCVAIKRSCFEKTGLFDESLTHGEDVDYWSRLVDNCLIAKSEVITTLYRTSAENRASHLPEILKKKKENVILMAEIKNPSQQLFLGCEFLMGFADCIKSGKISLIRSFLPFWQWMLRASLLYFKHRVLIRVFKF